MIRASSFDSGRPKAWFTAMKGMSSLMKVTRPPPMPTSLSLRTVAYPVILGSFSADRNFDSCIRMISVSNFLAIDSSSIILDLMPFAFHCTMLRLLRIFTSVEGLMAVGALVGLVIPVVLWFVAQLGQLQVPTEMYITCSSLERPEQLLWLSRRQPAHISGRAVGRVVRSQIRHLFLDVEGLVGGVSPTTWPTKLFPVHTLSQHRFQWDYFSSSFLISSFKVSIYFC